MQMGAKKHIKLAFSPLLYLFIYNVGKLSEVIIPLNFPQFPHQLIRYNRTH